MGHGTTLGAMETRGVDVREAALDDLEALTDLAVQVQALHAQGRPDLFRPAEALALRDFLAGRLADDSVLLVAADHTAKPVGYLLAEVLSRPESPFQFGHTSVYVHHIAVDVTARRQRIGEVLMRGIADRARQVGASSLRLDSWSFNADAHAFFERQGFTATRFVFERHLDSPEP